jgi:hypothetical protein
MAIIGRSILTENHILIPPIDHVLENETNGKPHNSRCDENANVCRS